MSNLISNNFHEFSFFFFSIQQPKFRNLILFLYKKKREENEEGKSTKKNQHIKLTPERIYIKRLV